MPPPIDTGGAANTGTATNNNPNNQANLFTQACRFLSNILCCCCKKTEERSSNEDSDMRNPSELRVASNETKQNDSVLYAKIKKNSADYASSLPDPTMCHSTTTWLVDQILNEGYQESSSVTYSSEENIFSEENIDNFINILRQGCFYKADISDGQHSFVLEVCNQGEGFIIYQSDASLYSLEEWLCTPDEKEANENFCALDPNREKHLNKKANYGSGKAIGKESLRNFLTKGHFEGGFALDDKSERRTMKITVYSKPEPGQTES